VKKKLLIALPVVLLLAAGGAFKMGFIGPKKASAKEKISGALVPLDPEFVVNLAGGRYAKVSVAVDVPVAPAAAEGAAPELKQNAAVRAVITDVLTGAQADELISRTARHKLLVRLAKALRVQTDESIKRVYLTDIAIQ
jgi:flagellar basal body-associated protein FliL